MLIHQYQGRNFNPTKFRTPDEAAAARRSVEARFGSEAEALEYAKDYEHAVVKRPAWLDPQVAVQQLGGIDCSVWAKTFQAAEGGQVMHLKPAKGNPFNATGALPGEVPARFNYQYHSFVVKDGKVFDQLNPKGIAYDEWVAQFKKINKMTDDQFSKWITIDTVPHAGATAK